MSRPFSWLLNTVYLGLLIIALPKLLWSAWRHGKYRHGWVAKLWGHVPLRQGTRTCCWLHAVSVGEVNLLASIIEALASRRPDVEVVVSATTQSGYDLACRNYPHLQVFYCPLDFSWAVHRTLRRIRPDVLVLAELELWPQLIAAARSYGTRIAIVNGRLSAVGYRQYSLVSPAIARVLRQIDVIAAQDTSTANKFVTLGAEPNAVHVTGSLKFDRAVTDRHNPHVAALQKLAQLSDHDMVFLAGSTQAPEEEIALRVYQSLRADFPKLRLMLVPRHVHRSDEVADLLDRAAVVWERRSGLGTCESAQSERFEVLLVDTIGELGAWWGTAHVGFVGGSFGDRGGQNMLEPTALGVATCFGPNTWNFRDIVAKLLDAEAACVVRNEHELQQFVRRALTDHAWAERLTMNARQLVVEQQGATHKTVDLLLPLLADRVETKAA